VSVTAIRNGAIRDTCENTKECHSDIAAVCERRKISEIKTDIGRDTGGITIECHGEINEISESILTKE